ncbi:hypothetical protein IQ224_03960 [Microcystis sp. LEGE 00066]|uniref:Similarity. Hypothetical start n=1 Tax=Microcystis aeruginosa (strain PCC 7806) TaxID=267872 RepID=A8Y9L3_MICA7|nr:MULTISPECIES: hypothetical protein [Microcystis]MBE9261411.1 hypothetical protein [Microcystis sp. LEGE 00066]MDB9430742.1 hypothetical protein [Microcystis aeruginosa CS-555/01A07]UGS10742.1 hypothetical protein LRR78_09100 [Microcystis aeruginosa FACHB-905 = DIANCHI905]WKX61865.1 hypothetical protein Q3H53_001822 [Microcystis aeruginosa PCC 7806]CAO86205.1 unnamed protein product [Microcystis aeruginosa PCC 7806]
MKTSVIYITAVLTLLGLTVSRQAKTFNLSENKDFLIAQSGQVYKCINDHGRFSIVPGIPGATSSRVSCLIPVKSVKRCMYKRFLDKTFHRCSLAIPALDGVPVNTYYSIGTNGGLTTLFTID